MVLQLAADLQPVGDQHGRQLGDELLLGVGLAALGAAHGPIEPGAVPAGVALLVRPGGGERLAGGEGLSLRHPNLIEGRAVTGAGAAPAGGHGPGLQHSLSSL